MHIPFSHYVWIRHRGEFNDRPRFTLKLVHLIIEIAYFSFWFATLMFDNFSYCELRNLSVTVQPSECFVMHLLYKSLNPDDPTNTAVYASKGKQGIPLTFS